MKPILIILILASALIPFKSLRTQDFDPIYDVSDVMSDLLKTAPARKLYRNHKKRYAFAKDIVAASRRHKIPELLFTVKIFNESSFRMGAVSTDKYKTKGLGQMHGVAAKGCDMSTRAGQLDCSAKWLRVCRVKCGTWEGALTAYATSGQCSFADVDFPWERKKKLWKTINRQMRMWIKYEHQRESIRNEIINDAEHIASLKN